MEKMLVHGIGMMNYDSNLNMLIMQGIKHISWNSYMNSGQPRINHTVYVDS